MIAIDQGGGKGRGGIAAESDYTFLVVADAPRSLRPNHHCGFRILVVLGRFYSNARHKTCEGNEADCHHVIAAPPLMHGKGHGGLPLGLARRRSLGPKVLTSE
jgi:hypothetical protein